MKYFIDTEFIESFTKPLFGKKRHFIDLISIAIVSEDGREYYAISNEYNYNDADSWVKENVILPLYREQYPPIKNDYDASNFHEIVGKSNNQIAKEIKEFCTGSNIEFYGYYADYDWVLFCSLFGRMIDLPNGFPMYCMDLKQMMQEKGLTSQWKQSIHPDPIGVHSALVDAKWNKELLQKLK